MTRLSASASGRHHAIANRSFAHSYTGKTCRRAQVESPVVFCEGGYTQSTGFWDYNIHKKLFQAYFRAAPGNVKVRLKLIKKFTSSEPEFFIKKGLKLSPPCKGGLKPSAHRTHGSVRGFLILARLLITYLNS